MLMMMMRVVVDGGGAGGVYGDDCGDGGHDGDSHGHQSDDASGSFAISRSYGVTASTLDSESSDRGSNPRRTLFSGALDNGFSAASGDQKCWQPMARIRWYPCCWFGKLGRLVNQEPLHWPSSVVDWLNNICLSMGAQHKPGQGGRV